jgi:hypothetical protein
MVWSSDGQAKEASSLEGGDQVVFHSPHQRHSISAVLYFDSFLCSVAALVAMLRLPPIA